ncbi:hypothetical protein [Phascolarctobacterium faecium]|uniref:hypothetical protein n=1 Tax=Phascolarctobacterium faecium TaxID=33025 RepID=UPI00307AA401
MKTKIVEFCEDKKEFQRRLKEALQEFVDNQEKVKIYYSVTCDPANSDMIYSALIVHI